MLNRLSLHLLLPLALLRLAKTLQEHCNPPQSLKPLVISFLLTLKPQVFL